MASSLYTGAFRFFGLSKKDEATRPGMILAFRPDASHVLADIPARVVSVGQRFRSGEYLVTIEFARPIKYHNEVIRRIDAFRSELYQPEARVSRQQPSLAAMGRV
jgi:hypothetical protein